MSIVIFLWQLFVSLIKIIHNILIFHLFLNISLYVLEIDVIHSLINYISV